MSDSEEDFMLSQCLEIWSQTRRFSSEKDVIDEDKVSLEGARNVNFDIGVIEVNIILGGST